MTYTYLFRGFTPLVSSVRKASLPVRHLGGELDAPCVKPWHTAYTYLLRSFTPFVRSVSGVLLPVSSILKEVFTSLVS